ncbi:MAG: ABC transporter substrate-binding protein [Rhodocyclaceae bacterium]|nr:ABC transporter substrate-binding protein [Rhodocyclaceae bacterium]MBX3677819.1 ABC transporter substrate-binding protein [Rhodocyclaceae bacterium]MCP5295878.1 ABC transporter substrate-binding protein [Zoogloeaceae bacterium]
MSHSVLRHCLAALSLTLASATYGADAIIIGQVAPYSGPLAPTGSHVGAGAQLYFERINAAGGIHGAKIRLVTKDDGYKVVETVKLTRELLKQSSPIALVGMVGTGNVGALVKERVLADADIPVVGIRSGAMSLVSPVVPQLFHTRASYAAEVEKIVQQLATTGIKRVAVLYQDDPFGLDGLAGAEKSLDRHKLQMATKAAYEKNTTRVEAAVKAIAEAKPQAVIMVSNTAASAEFVKQSRAIGNDAQLLAISVTDGPQLVKRIGKEVAHGLGLVQVVPDPGSRALAITRDLQDDYKKYAPKGIELNHTLLEGYLSGKVLAEGLKRAGPHPTRKKLREALEAMRDYDAGGLSIRFSPSNHSGSDYLDITILNRDGRILR